MKIFDVVNFDMMHMMPLPFVPGAVEWVCKKGDVKSKLAISDRNSSSVHIYDAHAVSNEPIISREVCYHFTCNLNHHPLRPSTISDYIFFSCRFTWAL